MIQLFNMDCMEAMRGMKDKEYDLAIVDPPFFAGVANPSFYGVGLSGSGNRRGRYKKIDSWDTQIPNQEYYQELCRVSVNQIVWGINYFNFNDVSSGRLIWDKVNDHSTFSKAEIASCSLIKSVQLFRYRWCGFQQGPTCQVVEKRFHPTQKPVALYKWLLKHYAKPGNKILDTHLGSGSSAIAAYDMGFDFTGYEIDEEYFAAAKDRLDKHMKQGRLFDDVPDLQTRPDEKRSQQTFQL